MLAVMALRASELSDAEPLRVSNFGIVLVNFTRDGAKREKKGSKFFGKNLETRDFPSVVVPFFGEVL
jgi:hypothetical protein